MEKVASLAILLVCSMASSAHATASVQNDGGINTFHAYGPNGTTESSIKSPESTHVSVVENWSLVCEDLCRVGFGGPRCGPSCIVGSNRPSNDSKKFSDLCPVLCDFQLGGRNCACPLAPKRLNGKTICRVLCRKFQLKVRGCSECTNAERNFDEVLKLNAIRSTSTSTPTEMVTTTILFSKSTETTASPTVETTFEVLPTTSQEPVTPTATTTALVSTKGSSSSIEPNSELTTGWTTHHHSESTAENTSEATKWTAFSSSTVTETTTRKSSTPTEPSTTTTTTTTVSTTPNWGDLCHSLCKIGEGGSLCNCDLPPLMSV